MRIDTHIHLYDPRLGLFGWPCKKDSQLYRRVDAAEFRAVSDGYDIDAAIEIGCSAELWQTGLLLGMYRDEPAVAAVIGESRSDDEQFIDYYEQYRHQPKFRGFRIGAAHPFGDQSARNIAHLNGKRANIIEILGHYSKIAALEPVVEGNPGVTFIIDHFGGFPMEGGPVPNEYLDFLAAMAAHPNVVMKTSGTMTVSRVVPAPSDPEFYRAPFEACLAAFGEDRCMFGSDWPVMALKSAYGHCVEVMEALLEGRAPGVREKVMGENARRVYKL